MNKCRALLFYVLIWLALNAQQTFSQQAHQDIRFEHLSNEQGLSQSSAIAILQDRQGFIWIGTDDGLNCYDGYGFTVYRYDAKDSTSISGYPIYSLCEDREGSLWIGTLGGGLDKFDPVTKSFEHFINDPKNPHSLSNNTVLSIHQDRAGSIWAGTDGGGLNRFDPKTKTFEHYTHNRSNPHSLSNNSVEIIHEDRSGLLWIGTKGGGLNKFDLGANRIFFLRAKMGQQNKKLWRQLNKICRFVRLRLRN